MSYKLKPHKKPKVPYGSPPKRKWGIQCLKCNDRIFSWWGHDFKHCKCGACFVDGGNNYLRYGATKLSEVKRVYHTKKDGPRVDIENAKNRQMIRDTFPR